MTIDGRKLKQEYVFTGRGTVAELLADIDQVTELESGLKNFAKLLRWLALAAFALMAASAVVLGKFMLFLGLVAAIALLVYAGVVGSRIMHDRVELLRLLLGTLSEDSGSRCRYQVLLQLRSQRVQLSQGPNPHSKSGKQTFFRDQWLTLNGKLGDGSAIFTSCADLIRQRTKKNPRGKIKKKERRSCLVRLHLTYNAARYGDPSVVAQKLPSPFRLPDKTQMKAFACTGGALEMKAAVSNDPTPKALHGAFTAVLLGAYHVLHSARRRSAAGGAK